MNVKPTSAQDRVRSLRADFDRSFGQPYREDLREFEGLITMGISGDPYALRLSDIAAMGARPRIVSLPSRRPEFLGMAGHHGSLIALFSLSQLLGYSGGGAASRWFILLRAAGSLGLAFDDYEGYARVAVSDIHDLGDSARRRFVTQAVRHAGTVRLIVNIPGMVDALVREKQEN